MELMCKPSEKNSGFIDVYANDVLVGYLQSNKDNSKLLEWHPHSDMRYGAGGIVRFQFRETEVFTAVVDSLDKYRKEQGYIGLLISTEEGEFGAILEEEKLKRAGFIYYDETLMLCAKDVKIKIVIE